MPMPECTQCDVAFEPYNLKAMSNADIKVLQCVLQTEEKRLDAIKERLEDVCPREAGVSDAVYEILNAYRAGQELLAEELKYHLSALLTTGRVAANHPHFEQNLSKMLAREMKVRGLGENVI